MNSVSLSLVYFFITSSFISLKKDTVTCLDNACACTFEKVLEIHINL